MVPTTFEPDHIPTDNPTIENFKSMATPLIVGIGAITAAVAARHVMRNGVGFGKKAAQELVKGGFKAKMDRSEAIEILGLKCVLILIAEYRVRGSPVVLAEIQSLDESSYEIITDKSC
jgi:hypothetical protein